MESSCESCVPERQDKGSLTTSNFIVQEQKLIPKFPPKYTHVKERICSGLYF